MANCRYVDYSDDSPLDSSRESPRRLNFPPVVRVFGLNSACDRGSAAITPALSHPARQQAAALTVAVWVSFCCFIGQSFFPLTTPHIHHTLV